MNRLCQLAPTRTRRALVGAATLVAVLAPGASAQALTPATTPAARIVPTVIMATGYNFGGSALNIAVPAPACFDFTGGRTILNEEVSSLMIPPGFVLTLFDNFGCSGGFVTLVGGPYPDLRTVGFDNRASSFLAVGPPL